MQLSNNALVLTDTIVGLITYCIICLVTRFVAVFALGTIVS